MHTEREPYAPVFSITGTGSNTWDLGLRSVRRWAKKYARCRDPYTFERRRTGGRTLVVGSAALAVLRDPAARRSRRAAGA
jgi:hypothetical protein